MVSSYKDLNVWQKSIELTTRIYKIVNGFPKKEQFCLASQITRATVSIPSNIAEGHTRASTKEYVQFLYIALGSSAELETQLMIANNIGYIDDFIFNEVIESLLVIRKMVNALISKLKGKK